jgi:hypothetical protein
MTHRYHVVLTAARQKGRANTSASQGNATKPYGNILDFHQQQDTVDAAIALFSGEATGEKAREIWLVEKAHRTQLSVTANRFMG